MSWLHLFRNILTDEVFAAYAPFLRQVKPGRQLQCEFGPTFVWKNTQQQVVIYDKIAEMRHRGYDVSVYPANIMRCEHRFIKGAKIKSVLRGRTVETLWNEYSNLGDIYNQAIQHTLFSTPLPDDAPSNAGDLIVGSQLEKEMKAFKSARGRNWLPSYSQALGANALHEQGILQPFHETFTHITECDGSTASTRQRIYRVNRDTDTDLLMLASLRTPDSSTKTLGTLYRELESKLILANS